MLKVEMGHNLILSSMKIIDFTVESSTNFLFWLLKIKLCIIITVFPYFLLYTCIWFNQISFNTNFYLFLPKLTQRVFRKRKCSYLMRYRKETDITERDGHYKLQLVYIYYQLQVLLK